IGTTGKEVTIQLLIKKKWVAAARNICQGLKSAHTTSDGNNEMGMERMDEIKLRHLTLRPFALNLSNSSSCQVLGSCRWHQLLARTVKHLGGLLRGRQTGCEPNLFYLNKLDQSIR